MKSRELLAQSAVLGCVLLACGVASAQVAQPAMTISHPTGFAVSRPMSEMSPALPASTLSNLQTVIPVRLPGPAGAAAPNLPDPVLQTTPGELLDEDGGAKALFPGVGANGSAPGDPNMAVGPNHIVQIVNTEYAVYDKSGNIFPGYPKTLGSIFTALGNTCTGEWGDPIAQYDKVADRWLLSQLGTFNTPGIECIAVSQTNDPTGAYFLYSYVPSNNAFNDYPKITVWPTTTNSAYLATYNLFDASGSGIGAELCAYDRAAMLAGAGAASTVQICFTINNDFSYLPSDLDGSTLPPAGAPGYFLNFQTPNVRPLSTLGLYKLAPNFANPGSSTLSAPLDITVASFYPACAGIVCIPQPGTTQLLDSLGDRLMYRLAYRNFGDHDTLVVNHSVATSTSTGVRWYELRSPLTGVFTLYQQGTFGPDATSRWMGSAAMDSAGDIAIGYSASDGNSVFPGLRYTGRTPTDPLGTLRTESIMFNGIGSQTGGLNRWGDYSALRIGPSDDCTFWYTNQYLPNNGSFNWATFVGSFKFTNCGTPTADFSLSASPASQTVTQGGGTSYTATVSPLNGFTGNVSLSVTAGLPSGASASFSPNPINGGSGTSTLTVTTSSSTPTGTYTLTITGTSGSLTHTTTVTLVVNPVATPDFSISASPSSRTVTQGNSTTYTVTATPVNGFTGNVSLSVTAGLPSGASASFNPNPITGGSGSSTMSVTTSSSTPTGTFTLTITGTSGSLTHTATVTLVVNPAATPNFSISATPSSRTVTQGGSTTYTATATPSGGFTGSVTLSASGLPSGASASFSPNPITGGSGNSTMTVTTSTSTPTGTYTLTITGTSGSLTHSTTVTLVVSGGNPGFSISASPTSQTVIRPNSTTYTITVTAVNGFTGNVTLSARSVPSGATASFSPTSVAGHGTSTLTISTTSSTSTGPFSVRIRGSNSGTSHSVTVRLTVQ